MKFTCLLLNILILKSICQQVTQPYYNYPCIADNMADAVEDSEIKRIAPLLRKCRNGDLKAIETFYKSFYSYGMSISMRYCINKQDAQEVLNDSFLKMLKNLDRFDLKRPIRPWFRRILINTALNRNRAAIQHLDIEEVEGIYTLKDNPKAIDRMGHEELIQLIQQLSPQYRLVFNLYVIDGYSHEEIAEMLEISVGTSKSNLARARINLRAMLKKNTPVIFAKYG